MVGVRNLNKGRACIPILGKIGYCYFWIAFRDYHNLWFRGNTTTKRRMILPCPDTIDAERR